MNVHGNKTQKWKIDYRLMTNDFVFTNLDNSEYHVLPVVRDACIDLSLYLRRLQASDDSIPVTIRNDTYRNMAREIIDKTDQIVYIRKGKWAKTVLEINEEIEKIKIEKELNKFLKSNKSFNDFKKENLI